MIRVSHVSVDLGGSPILSDISLHLEKGQWMMLCGPNGAGKSTLLRAIAQNVPYRGTIELCGHRAQLLSAGKRARLLGVLLQRNSPGYAYSVEEVVSLGRYAYRKSFLDGRDPEGAERMEEAMALLGLEGLRHKSVLTLSGGELQRVFLAQVIAQNPKVLLLDEPANHLDPKQQMQLFERIGRWLSQGDRAVLSVVHDLSLAKHYGTHGCLLCSGQCRCTGEIHEVLQEKHLRTVYDMNVGAWMRTLLEEWKKT